MRRTRTHLLTTFLTATALAVAHALAPRAASADTAIHRYTLTPLSEYCQGTCVAGSFCCKITIIAPPP